MLLTLHLSWRWRMNRRKPQKGTAGRRREKTSRQFATNVTITYDILHMEGDLLETPAGFSLRHLSRKLTRSIHFKAVGDLWRQRADLDNAFRHRWLGNLQGDSPTQPESYHGHGEWLHCLPGKWDPTLLDPVIRLGLCQRFGHPDPGMDQRCGRPPTRGANSARTFWTHAANMRHVAPKGYTPEDMIAAGIC